MQVEHFILTKNKKKKSFQHFNNTFEKIDLQNKTHYLKLLYKAT